MTSCDRYMPKTDFFNKLLIDSWCSIYKIVNHIYDRGFKGLLESVISTDKFVPLRLCVYVHLIWLIEWSK